MSRLGRIALVVVGTIFGAAYLLGSVAGSDADRDAAVKNHLLVQSARVQAIKYLLDRQHAKAVDILESRLEHIDASQEYLTLLRDAYRAYIKELSFNKQESLVEKYQARLNILEGTARPSTKPSDTPLSPVLGGEGSGVRGSIPGIAALRTTNPALLALRKSIGASSQAPPRKDEPKAIQSYLPETPAIKPAGLEGAKTPNKTNPFALGSQAPPPSATVGTQIKQAQALLAQAETEFSQKRYGEARRLFDQAHQLDDKATAGCQDRWAYCKLHHVVEQMKLPTLQGSKLTDLESEVRAAVVMAPQLDKTGKWLLGEITGRKGTPVAGVANPPATNPAASNPPATNPPATNPQVAVRHYPRNATGWSMAETAHFRIFHNQSPDLAEQVARGAEETHVSMYRKWFGKDGADWNPKCDLYLHATAQDYNRATGVPTNSPGHSRIETDPSATRVVSRRVDLHCENPTMLQCVLPHETTHVVLAGQFGNFQVPRWVDEGIAVLAEPADKVEQHRRNLVRCQRDKELFHVKELMQLTDYPQARRVAAFYAQSVTLVEFLSEQRGPIVFCHFVRDGLREGYESALRKHYRIQNFGELQERWQQQLQAIVSRPSSHYLHSASSP
jgi:tetratricopeptide (TPR) repeat protein